MNLGNVNAQKVHNEEFDLEQEAIHKQLLEKEAEAALNKELRKKQLYEKTIANMQKGGIFYATDEMRELGIADELFNKALEIGFILASRQSLSQD